MATATLVDEPKSTSTVFIGLVTLKTQSPGNELNIHSDITDTLLRDVSQHYSAFLRDAIAQQDSTFRDIEIVFDLVGLENGSIESSWGIRAIVDALTWENAGKLSIALTLITGTLTLQQYISPPSENTDDEKPMVCHTTVSEVILAETLHTVKKGENLHMIAALYTCEPTLSHEAAMDAIYHINQSLFGGDRDSINAGVVLVIPSTAALARIAESLT
ncbi:type IV pilus assembly protein FimV [Motilimonas pumila]|uniref:LysM domain-containing protein n=1 Tax=Motilimonas pumila TaxID=2303987 RepID=A0A418YA29_9GAMM|nr:hypothetical protein [Motilimonas pumila]RJG38780.1 hypothetical protein D1Z90_18725 [Motilimonas pumila]